MMLMQMRLQKNQVASLYQYKTAGSFAFFERSLAIMAGYKTFDAIVVGAAGGWGVSTHTRACGGGPGGGGTIRLQGSLLSIPENTPVVVGAVGADGFGPNYADSTGMTGGTSSLSTFEAYGGVGGGYGRWAPTSFSYSGDGGNGGGNSAGLGSAGVGGSGAGEDFLGGGHSHNATSSTAGAYAAGGSGLVVAGGKGGGGGCGKFDGDVVDTSARVGSTGNNTVLADTGGAAVSDKGGAGGGANLNPVTGVDEYYGTKIAGKHGQGAVVIKLS